MPGVPVCPPHARWGRCMPRPWRHAPINSCGGAFVVLGAVLLAAAAVAMGLPMRIQTQQHHLSSDRAQAYMSSTLNLRRLAVLCVRACVGARGGAAAVWCAAVKLPSCLAWHAPLSFFIPAILAHDGATIVRLPSRGVASLVTPLPARVGPLANVVRHDACLSQAQHHRPRCCPRPTA